MEANFFRFLAAELAQKLTGRRIDKVFNPAPGVWTLALQNAGSPLYLMFRPAKSAGHLFLSATKPANPATAPAMAMWFRKRLRNRKIISISSHWPSLRLALELTPRNDAGSWLILDCRASMELADKLPPDFGTQPDWPALEDVLTEPDIWKEYPHLSPPMRHHLKSLPEEEAHQHYLAIVSATAPNFFLPSSATECAPPLAWPPKNKAERFDSALTAATAYGERTLFSLLEMEEDKPQKTLLKRARKKIKRNLTRLDEEELRLSALAAEQVKAEALQAELYKIKNTEGLATVRVIHPVHGEMDIPMNPHLTPAENMARYFKNAAKAQRGFSHVARRRRELLEELKRIEDGSYEFHPAQVQQNQPPPDGPPALPKRYRSLAVSLFRSSDGFSIIRGKNKKANHDILSKAASPFDYWFHVADGPSSHVILKRDHPSQEVPASTLTEAAVLCGLKSYRSADGKADVMYALVKDIRKVKGFNIGQVAVDRKLGTLRVDLDPELEKQLT